MIFQWFRADIVLCFELTVLNTDNIIDNGQYSLPNPVRSDTQFVIDSNNIELRNVIQKPEADRRTINNFDKFCLLMWKNVLLQHRHKLQTFIQIVIPILFTANLLFIRSLFEPEHTNNNVTFEAFNINEIYLRLVPNF